MYGIHYSSRDKMLKLLGKGGAVRMQIPDDASVMLNVHKVTATLPIVNIGTRALAVATLTNVVGLTTNEHVIANVRGTLIAGVIVNNVRVTAANTVQIELQNVYAHTAGSQPAGIVDLLAFKF